MWKIEHFQWKFKNFLKSQEFVNKVGSIAESEGHHPDIWFGWGYAKIKIQNNFTVINSEGQLIVMSRNCKVIFLDVKTKKEKLRKI